MKKFLVGGSVVMVIYIILVGGYYTYQKFGSTVQDITQKAVDTNDPKLCEGIGYSTPGNMCSLGSGCPDVGLCKYEVGIKNKNTSACFNMYSSLKIKCLAESSNDPASDYKLCDQFTLSGSGIYDNGRCYGAFAGKLQSFELCRGFQGRDSEARTVECVKNYVRTVADEKACGYLASTNKIPSEYGSGIADVCYLIVSDKLHDRTICNKILSQVTKKSCLEADFTF